MSIYRITNLTRVYQNRTVLDIPSLEIEAGAIYALLGPNGAGKTTLLNILAFLEPPTSGRIRFYEKPVRFSETELQKLRRRVVLLDQQPILFTTSVRNNIEFGLKIRNMSPKVRAPIVEEVLDLVGMRDFIQAPAHRLSGGETQRVAIARALAVAPDVFLCDEPTSSVDVQNQTAILNILRRINAHKKITILMATHNFSQAAALAHHMLFLHDGRLGETPRENIFAAKLGEAQAEGLSCMVEEVLPLLMSPTQTVQGKNGRVRIFIDPKQVVLNIQKSDKTSPNNFEGSIVQITKESEHIRITTDIGIRLCALISKETYRGQNFFVGEAVTVVMPPESIQLLS